ncbi:NAD(P)-binding protein [Pholiota conissans]|uniref:NAD(P)-binding protein n=1 Tax=Pholiota conissans TaxID=109636 RepID=A0A9P5YMN3_9AGAR|nr:NAD(P)-binding protein [Pholiota conissans]
MADSSRVWLITGTSSGFGKRIAKVALERGDRVIATARSIEKLQELEEGLSPEHRQRFRKAALDVTEGEDAIKAKVDAMATFWGGIDILINNAGFGLVGLIEEGGTKQLRRQFETNVFGVMDVTAAALPHLRESKDAAVVVVGSRSVWIPELVGIGPYAASKAAVHAITENLSSELAPFNIKVCLVQPGGFRTEGIYGQPYFTGNPIPAYDTLREASIKRFAGVPGSEKGDPDKAAIAIVDVVRGEGVAKGRPWPPYLVLGEDAEVNVKNKCAKVLKVLDEWVDVARGVSFDPPQDGHSK